MLLQYAGHGTWAVRKKRRQWNEPTDWEVVPNAHPAVITEEQARLIGQARERARERHSNRSARMAAVKSSHSRFTFSGGKFRCGRCGARMAGETNNGKSYYACGTVIYRRGIGCGIGVHVPKELLEAKIWEVAHEWLKDLLARGSDSLLRQVNAELRQAWISAGGCVTDNRHRLGEIEKAIAALRSALEKGVDDIEWVNQRLRELRREQEALQAADSRGRMGEAPTVDMETVRRYAADLPKLVQQATNEERRELARAFVTGIELIPTTREIGVGLRVPLLSATCGGGGRNRTGG